MDRLCKHMRARHDLAVVTNDICTREDAEALMRSQALPLARLRGVETGGCPHAAIREDASINLAAIAPLRAAFSGRELVFIESGGDNLTATFSPELADLRVMERAARRMRRDRPFLLANLRAGQGVAEIAGIIESRGGLAEA